MNNGLTRKITNLITHEKAIINVWCLVTKTVVFTGSTSDVARFIGTNERSVSSYLKKKVRFRKKYALRHAKAI